MIDKLWKSRTRQTSAVAIRSEMGASLVETAMLLALCALLSVVTLQLIGQSINSTFTTVASSGFQGAPAGFGGATEEGGGSETAD